MDGILNDQAEMADSEPCLIAGARYSLIKGRLGSGPLVRLDSGSGKPDWTFKGGNSNQIHTAAGQVAYAGCLNAINIAVQQLVWEPDFQDDARCRFVTILDNQVLVDVYAEFHRQQPGLFAFDRATEALRWRVDVPNAKSGASLATPPCASSLKNDKWGAFWDDRGITTADHQESPHDHDSTG